jgi:hypothetical protein
MCWQINKDKDGLGESGGPEFFRDSELEVPLSLGRGPEPAAARETADAVAFRFSCSSSTFKFKLCNAVFEGKVLYALAPLQVLYH